VTLKMNIEVRDESIYCAKQLLSDKKSFLEQTYARIGFSCFSLVICKFVL
jgi:hypothetical protein